MLQALSTASVLLGGYMLRPENPSVPHPPDPSSHQPPLTHSVSTGNLVRKLSRLGGNIGAGTTNLFALTQRRMSKVRGGCG